MTFGRLVHFVTPPSALTARRLWVPPRRTTLIFVLFDVVSFLIQFLGLLIVAGAYGPDKSSEDKAAAIAKGQHVLQLGIVVQLLCFGLFAIVGARFLYVSRGWAAPGGTEWHLLAWVINVSAGLIMVRARLSLFPYFAYTYTCLAATCHLPSRGVLGPRHERISCLSRVVLLALRCPANA